MMKTAEHISTDRTSSDRLIQEAADLLLRDLTYPPSLTELADKLGIGRYQLSRLFRASTNQTIPGMLRKHRIAQAAKLLHETNAAVTDVARNVGYESVSAFSRAFLREMGMSPLPYRKNAARGNISR